MNDNDTPQQDDAGADNIRDLQDARAAGPGDEASGEDAMRAEVADAKDRLLRTMADMENLRRRTEREKSDARRYAITAFANDLLNVGDNLSRALHSLDEKARAAADDDIANMIAGVEMTERELLNVFGRHGIERVDPTGGQFDPNFHQAMFEIEDKSIASGTIIEVMQPGYMIGDRVLRPAMVSVAKGGAKAQPAAEGDNPQSPADEKTAKPAKAAKNKKTGPGVGGNIDRSA